MKFFDILYFLSISLSFSAMWSFSEIFGPLRNFVSRIPYVRRPLICPECSSFWFGFFASFLYNPIVINFDILILSNLICGLITHLFAILIYRNLIASKKRLEKEIDFI
jgi:hypothetical protein